MSSIEQIIADHKRKQAEAEAKKVEMPRREWIEYLPQDYKELIGGLMDKDHLDYVVDSWWDAVVVGPGGRWEDRPFYKEDFWFQLSRWSKGESQHLPYIPGIRKHPMYFPLPEVSKKPVVAVEKPVKKEIRTTEVKVEVAPIVKDETSDQPTEIITTRHTIPYNGGNLPLFASL